MSAAPGAPRCGREMIAYETAGHPALDASYCGRPEGHNPPCRSVQAVVRAYAAKNERLAGQTQPCECGCGEIVRWGNRFRHNHSPRRPDGTLLPLPARIFEAAA